jgi:large subunit ribosomal protein L21
VIRITEILTDGKKPSKTPPERPKRVAKPKPEAAEGAEGDKKAAKKPAARKKAAKSAA